MTSQTFGLSYTIAPGLTSLLETTSADYTDNTAGSNNNDGLNQTTAKIKVSSNLVTAFIVREGSPLPFLCRIDYNLRLLGDQTS